MNYNYCVTIWPFVCIFLRQVLCRTLNGSSNEHEYPDELLLSYVSSISSHDSVIQTLAWNEQRIPEKLMDIQKSASELLLTDPHHRAFYRAKFYR